LADNVLLGPLFGSAEVDREVGGRAWLQALLDVERSFAAAQARAGLIPGSAAAAIAACCTADRFDAASLGRRALGAGNPVVPLVADLTALLPAEAARYVHSGATSQDILDTAMMLVASRALGPILADPRTAADRCAELAEREAGTVMAGRTLLQQALPVTAGLKRAGWLTALDEAAGSLDLIRGSRLAVEFGGAAGTLASLGEAGIMVAALLAEELQLAEPVLPWHTGRARVAEDIGVDLLTLLELAGDHQDLLLRAVTRRNGGHVARGARTASTGSRCAALPHGCRPPRVAGTGGAGAGARHRFHRRQGHRPLAHPGVPRARSRHRPLDGCHARGDTRGGIRGVL
jgi:3-carboxy-cis,cis-muconate cycloisomerase